MPALRARARLPPSHLLSDRRRLGRSLALPKKLMRKYLPLLAVVLIAFAMRVNRIRQPLIDAYSWREASTAMMAENFYRHSWNIFLPAVNWVGPQPGYQGREFQI